VTDVKAAFGDELAASPHKYRADEGWQYLTVTDPATPGGLVFEVDGQAVRNYRAGQSPQLFNVEQCG
jgi:hypothetical protein